MTVTLPKRLWNHSRSIHLFCSLCKRVWFVGFGGRFDSCNFGGYAQALLLSWFDMFACMKQFYQCQQDSQMYDDQQA